MTTSCVQVTGVLFPDLRPAITLTLIYNSRLDVRVIAGLGSGNCTPVTWTYIYIIVYNSAEVIFKN